LIFYYAARMGAERWASGAAYEPYVGRWSRLVAAEFVAWLGVPGGARWVDVGCGTGAVSETIVRLGDPASVVGVDPSAGFIAHARAHVTDPRVRFEAGSADRLPLDDGAVDAAVSGLVLNFVPDAAAALAEMTRATRPGGTIGVYVWDYAGEMQLMRYFWDAAGDLDPRGREADEGVRFPLCRPEPLRALLTGAGLADVEARPIDVPTRLRDFDDNWTPFLSGQAPAPAYAMSLTEDRRAQLRDLIRSRLPHAADGAIPLIARAWAVRGTR
jgi:SAM-dependent methyltransferase